MINNVSFIKILHRGLLVISLFLTSGCLLKKETIPEYLPKISEKQEAQTVNRTSSSLAKALSEIKATTKENITLSTNGTMQTKEKSNEGVQQDSKKSPEDRHK